MNNIFPNETQPIIMDHNHNHDQWHVAEERNGRLAMLGFIPLIGADATTGQIIPGVL